MQPWVSFLLTARQRSETVIVVTVASTKGSAPRETGTKMIVALNDVHGSIGGGHLEFNAIDIAKGMIVADGPRALHRFALGATLGQCCGGVVNLLFEPVPSDAEWVDALAAQIASGGACVVVTPVSGDARTGKLILGANDCAVSFGTLGASALDADARATAQKLVRELQSSNLQSIPVDTAGATTRYFFDVLHAPDFHIVLFGAGHVGRALVRVMSELDCTIHWVDSRDDQFLSDIPKNVNVVVTDSPETEITTARPGSYFLVMTHSHALDQTLCERILKRNDFAYFGLIGSISKRQQFERRLLDRGISAAQLHSMNCPIGLADIAGKAPATIAISVAAEILQRRSECMRRAESAKPATSAMTQVGA